MRKALEAVKAAGEVVTRIEIDRDGKIVVIVGNPGEGAGDSRNEWDAKYGGG